MNQSPLDALGTQAELVRELDDSLHSLVSGIDILSAVAPLNYREAKQAFFDSNFSTQPDFSYAQHSIDVFARKRELYNLPADSIEDDDLRHLYLAIIDSYTDKLDQYKSIGSPEFLYDSLRYYGEPSRKDTANAKFLLHLPDESEEFANNDANAIAAYLSAFADHEGYTYNLIQDPNMIANALVSGLNVKINSSARVSDIELTALAQHELGVHLVTTLNSRQQPLKLLSLGCPINTRTQEGLAILSEYLCGCMTTRRLRALALRVLAVESMIKERNFRNTFLLLKEQHKASDELAFTITARVYRGGGFTKDYLYLQGLRQIINAYENENNFLHLLSGKVSLECLPQISNLIEKGILLPPSRITPAFKKPVKPDAVQIFISHALK